MDATQTTSKSYVHRAIQVGLMTSLYSLIVIVVIEHDYQRLTLLRWIGCGVFGTIFLSCLLGSQALWRRIELICIGLIGLLLIWVTAFVSASI